MSRYLLLVTSLIWLVDTSYAQDPSFSQFFANRVYLNPAYAGFDPGMQVAINYRDQWFGLPDGDLTGVNRGYRTLNLTGEWQLPCFLGLDNFNLGTAVTVFRDEAGAAPLRTQGFSWAFSYEQPLLRSTDRKLKRLDLRVGMQTALMQHRLKGNFFVYSDQLDPVIGVIDPMTVVDLNSRFFPNLNAGLLLRGYAEAWSGRKETLFSLGLNFANVNEPNNALDGVAEQAVLPMRMTLHGGFTYRITRFKGVSSPIYLAPQFRWDTQLGGKLNLQTIGTYVLAKGYYAGFFVQYSFSARNYLPPASVAAALLPRNTSSLILNAGMDIKSLLDNGVPWRKRDSGMVLGLTYDLNLGSLNGQQTLGVLELSLRMAIPTSKKGKGCGEISQFELYKGDCPVRF